MGYHGLDAISHGILYTEHKDLESVPGGGGAPDRYYIPTFHEFRSLSQTDLILHKHPELICPCEVCREVMKGNPDNIILFADNPDLLRRHFLSARRAEVLQMDRLSLSDQLDELDRTYANYHESISALPNPDAIVDPVPMRGLDYLWEWIRGMRVVI
jgi:hypothetical protein